MLDIGVGGFVCLFVCLFSGRCLQCIVGLLYLACLHLALSIITFLRFA